jgi:hypothetical protein
MTFQFRMIPVGRPAVTLGGLTYRPRPLLSVGITAPGRGGPREFEPLLVDTGADDVIFSASVAARVGIDLRRVPSLRHAGVTGRPFAVQYAEAELTVVAAVDHYVRWRATVGFADISRPVFGFAGGLQFFHASFDWAAGRFALVPRADLPAAGTAFPGPAAAVRVPA